MGDMNAYAKEDPMAAFENAGYINLKYTDASTEEQPFSYSYSGFLGSLDHMLGTSGMESRLVSIDDWHINSVESNLLDYDAVRYYDKRKDTIHEEHFEPATSDPYYSSDHDPVVAGFVMGKLPTQKPVGNDEEDDNGGALGFILLPLLAALLRTRRKLHECLVDHA